MGGVAALKHGIGTECGIEGHDNVLSRGRAERRVPPHSSLSALRETRRRRLDRIAAAQGRGGFGVFGRTESANEGSDSGSAPVAGERRIAQTAPRISAWPGGA